MRKVEFKVYKLNELPEEKRVAAFEKWFANVEYAYAQDNIDTLIAFEKAFDIDVNSWSYDLDHYRYKFTMNKDEDIEYLSGPRLRTYIVNNYWDDLFKPKTYYTKNFKKKRKSRILKGSDCPLTGYWTDNAILKPIYDFLKRPYEWINLHDLIDDCLRNYFYACSRDVADQYSKERFLECCEENDYEFFSDGRVYNGQAEI